MAREVNFSLVTIFIGLKIMFFVVRVFLSIDMLRSGTNHVVALQSNNAMGILEHFNHLKRSPGVRN